MRNNWSFCHGHRYSLLRWYIGKLVNRNVWAMKYHQPSLIHQFCCPTVSLSRQQQCCGGGHASKRINCAGVYEGFCNKNRPLTSLSRIVTEHDRILYHPPNLKPTLNQNRDIIVWFQVTPEFERVSLHLSCSTKASAIRACKHAAMASAFFILKT